MYLTQIRTFQRHLTTGAFKLAGGSELSSITTNPSRYIRSSVPQIFISKIVKAFLDSLYAFLDGMVHLTSDEPSTIQVPKTTGETTGSNPLELRDIENPVRRTRAILPCVLPRVIDTLTGHASSSGRLKLWTLVPRGHPWNDQ